MVIFDRLNISKDGKKLDLKVHVNEAEGFDNVYLDKILIITKDNMSETYTTFPVDKSIYYKKISSELNLKEISLVLGKPDFDEAFNNTDSEGEPINPNLPTARLPYEKASLSGELFFVFIECKGIPDECVPCPLQVNPVAEPVFDKSLLYQKVMDYTRELAADCTIPQGFTDFILLWNAYKASVETGHYKDAIWYYNRLFSNTNDPIGTGGRKCGCKG